MNGTDIYYLGALPASITTLTAHGLAVLRSFRTITIVPKKTAPKAKLRYFNSHAESLANQDYDRKPKYFTAGFIIKDPWMGYQPMVDACRAASLDEYFAKTNIRFEFYFDGQKRVFWYDSEYYTIDFRAWNKAQQFKEFSNSWTSAEYYNRFLVQKEISDINGSMFKVRKQITDAAAAYKKIKNKSEKDARYIAIVKALAAYNLQCEILERDKTFITKSQRLTVQISGTDQVGDFGLTALIAIAIIALSAAWVLTNKDTQDAKRKKDQYKLNFEAQYKNNALLFQAAQDVSNGKITQENFNAIKNQVTDANNALQNDAEKLTKTDPSMFGEIKNILLIGGGVILLSRVFKN